MINNDLIVISVDLGTSSVRASVVNRTLDILHQVTKPVSLNTSAEGKAEQNTDEISHAGLLSIKETLDWAAADNLSPEALCFSNAIASLVCLDSSFNPLRLALTYADLRSYNEAEALIKDYGQDFFLQTATPMHASYWLPKFLWLKNSSFNLSKCHYFCTLKDLLVYHLTGQFIIDISNAVATGMCNIKTGGWDNRLLEIAGISVDQLPEIHPTTTLIKTRNNYHQQPAFQLPPDLKIVLGAVDGVLSSLGVGAYKPGQVTTMIGSSGACRNAAKSPLIDCEALGTWSYPLDDEIWIRGGAMNSGGLVTKWLVENFTGVENPQNHHYEKMFDAAASINPGSDNLIFLPYLFGERAPIYDANARGVYFGLHVNHHRAHFARAGLEGILYALYSVYRAIQPEQNGDIEVRATGGYLQSEIMLQIQADIFNLPIQIPFNYEGSAIGAAILAFKALSIIDSYYEIDNKIVIKKVYQPDSEKVSIYQKGFQNFQELYQNLKPLFSPEKAVG